MEPRQLDKNKERKVLEFDVNGCGCKQKCSALFSTEHYQAARANAAELSWNELNMAVMGLVMALTSCDPLTRKEFNHPPSCTKGAREGTIPPPCTPCVHAYVSVPAWDSKGKFQAIKTTTFLKVSHHGHMDTLVALPPMPWCRGT